MKLIKDQERVVEEAKKGDENAFRELYRAFEKPVYRFIFRMVTNSDEAADITQDVFFKVYQKIDTCKKPEFFSSWLFSIARNSTISLMRKNKKEKHISIENSMDDESLLQLPCEVNDILEEHLIGKEFNHVFNELLSELPEIYRTAFVLGVIEKHSYQDVAEIMDCSIGNVKSRVFRARSMLNEKLTQKYENVLE